MHRLAMVWANESGPEVVRLRGPGEVAAAVPQLFGFVPVESFVAIALHAPPGGDSGRSVVGVSLRCDLPADETEQARVVTVVSRAIARDDADGVVLGVFTASRPRPGGRLPRRRLVSAVAGAVPAVVWEAVLVADGRWWSYLCQDDACCPVEGQLVEPTSAGVTSLAAAQAMTGRAVLPDRSAVVASLAPVSGPEATSVERALDKAAARYAAEGPPAFLAAARSLWDTLLDRYDAAPATMSPDEAAGIGVALHDISFRDDAVLATAKRPAATRGLLRELARLSLPPLDAPACTVLAWQAYCDGDGVVAGVALDRALASDPTYSLALLLDSALERQLDPRELRRLTRLARGPAEARSAARAGRGPRRSRR